jgi:hypothetical protein
MQILGSKEELNQIPIWTTFQILILTGNATTYNDKHAIIGM